MRPVKKAVYAKAGYAANPEWLPRHEHDKVAVFIRLGPAIGEVILHLSGEVGGNVFAMMPPNFWIPVRRGP